jgi:hypothetical protein
MEMEFGVPRVRQAKVEKYLNEGCFTFMPTGEKLGRKVVLNDKAIEMLDIEGSNNQISFSFNGDDIYVVNTSGIENCAGLKVGKTTNAFADKKQYEYIKTNIYELQPEDELELFLEETENIFNNNKVFKLVSKNNIMIETNHTSNNNEMIVLEAIEESEMTNDNSQNEKESKLQE